MTNEELMKSRLAPFSISVPRSKSWTIFGSGSPGRDFRHGR